MINASNNAKFTAELEKGNRVYQFSLLFTLLNGEQITIDNSDILIGGLSWENSSSDQNSFGVGGCIISELKVSLKNSDRRFNNIDFEGASVRVNVSLPYDGGVSSFTKGHFIVETYEYSDYSVELYCVDGLSLLDAPVPYRVFSSDTIPIDVAIYLIQACGLQSSINLMNTSLYPRSATYYCDSFTLSADDNVTCREIVSDIAALYGMFVTMDAQGKVQFKTCTYSGSSKHTFDKGVTSLTNSVKTITVTGIGFSYEDDEGNEQSILVGTDDYAIVISDNFLAPYINKNAYAQLVATRFSIGTSKPFSFRPFDITHYSDPRIEVGDKVSVYDIVRQEYFDSIITNLSFTASETMHSLCGAESNQKLGSTRYSLSAKSKTMVKEYVKKNASLYEDYLRNYAKLMTGGFGLYLSEMDDPIGSGAKVFVMHDVESFEASLFAMSYDADGFHTYRRESADEDWTITSTIASDGTAFFEVLYSREIIADKVKAGDIEVSVNHSARFGDFAFIPRGHSLMFAKVQ